MTLFYEGGVKKESHVIKFISVQPTHGTDKEDGLPKIITKKQEIDWRWAMSAILRYDWISIFASGLGSLKGSHYLVVVI